MRILVLDNYDSFTYNLVHILREQGHGGVMDVIRNDQMSVADVDAYSHILLSPGPGIPSEAGIMMDVIKTYAPTKTMLGVCLGHQGISESFGAELYNMPEVLHGIANKVALHMEANDRLFDGLPEAFMTCRYHSWSVKPKSVTDTTPLVVTARDENGEVMAIRHKEYDVRGVQFHPESILTEHGKQMIANWLADET
ncbi:MAG TPA: aminodeoxychorismate/anthranilate synthase component II [Cytophagales bacterium]|nr:aminodeoxychorismate/anthranilate synthase component II [Cytophagales bacterium]HAA18815.1 aminodeoxychorismate/anthranilate synthase component II [Cytophagales bacterium]HAP64355.1 aminodeoxychorismate/anthranilate synthase component II [Cytophagales bacterium]